MQMKATNFRWVLGFVMFLITLVAYMDRVNFAVAAPMIMSEFNFTKIEIGLLTTCFFVGYAAMQIPGGILADLFKHRKVVTITLTWWSFFTALTAACSSFFGFAAVRAVFGIGEGPLYPALTAFIAKWFPKTEKGRAAALQLAGGYAGPIIGPAIAVAIMTAVGWRTVFVAFGVIGLFVAATWYYLARVSPRETSFVNQAEIDLIEAGIVDETTDKDIAPWSIFLSSSQFWAVGVQFFITDYIMYVYLSWLPLYLMEAHGFSLQKMGFAAAFPWIALTIAVFITGWLGDRLVSAGVSKKIARSYVSMVGLLGCAIFLYLGAKATDQILNVLWLSLSLGSLGFTLATSFAVVHDLGGKYAGTVAGWINFWGNLGGVAAPIATAWVATVFSWESALVATAAAAVINIGLWFFVKPDISLKIKESTVGESKAI